MNLKEKAKEAKEYGEIKNQLIDLIKNYLVKYKEYEKIYKDIFDNWVNKLILDFETIFKAEGFNVATKTSDYFNTDNYKTITATLYDLEFELLIEIEEYQQIRFLQIKPTTESKNIIIRPTIKQHYIKGDKIKINNIYNLEKYNKRVENAEFSIKTMKDFLLELKREMELLLVEIEKIKTTNIQGIATPTNNGLENNKRSYGEFTSFSELVERI